MIVKFNLTRAHSGSFKKYNYYSQIGEQSSIFFNKQSNYLKANKLIKDFIICLVGVLKAKSSWDGCTLQFDLRLKQWEPASFDSP